MIEKFIIHLTIFASKNLEMLQSELSFRYLQKNTPTNKFDKKIRRIAMIVARQFTKQHLKSEYRNPKQILMFKIQMLKTFHSTQIAQINADYHSTIQLIACQLFNTYTFKLLN